MNTELVVSFEYEATHYWPNPPKEYKEFGNEHRHIFKIVALFPTHESLNPARRELELFELRRYCITKIFETFGRQFGGMSCEGIADAIINLTHASKVFVGEDWYLGAWVSQA